MPIESSAVCAKSLTPTKNLGGTHDEAIFDRVASRCEYDRCRLRDCCLCCECRSGAAKGSDNCDLSVNQIGHQS